MAALAWPLVATQFAQMAVMTTDVVMLGRLGDKALASAAIGNAFFYCAWLIGFGPVAALAPLIAQAEGAGLSSTGKVRRIARMGLWSILLISPPLMALLLFAGPILALLGQDPVVARGAGRLVSLFAIGLPFTLIFQALRNVSSAMGRPKPALYVMGATILFNAFMDWMLIFGNLGVPPLGLTGAGLATSSSFIFSAIAMAIVMRLSPRLRRIRPLRRFIRFDRGIIAEILRLGLPIGLTMMFEGMIFNTMTLVMGTLGSGPLAAHQIAMNFSSITFMAPLGVGMAGTIRVGLAAGAEDFAGVRRAGYAAATIGLGFISLCAVVMATLGRQIAALYIAGGRPEDLVVLSMAAQFLKVAAAFQVFDALQVIASLALRGLKDARAPMIIAGASYWAVGAPTCLFLAFPLHLGGMGIWYGLAFGLFVAAMALSSRFLILSRGPRSLRIC